MEQVLAASKSSLISSLDYSGSQAPVADYVQSRQQIQIFPQGGLEVAANSQREKRVTG
jgi:hypothetical protein